MEKITYIVQLIEMHEHEVNLSQEMQTKAQAVINYANLR